MANPSTVLIVGATRGLGRSLVAKYAASGATVFGTARSEPKDTVDPSIKWITNIDIGDPAGGSTLASSLKAKASKIDTTIVTAGYFPTESFDNPSWDEQLKTYKICSMGPLFVVQQLVKADLLQKGSKVILVSSEAGSLTLRHDSEGGGNYAHHASKTALNMCGKLLSYDLKDKGIAVGLVHPGFMRTELTKSAGLDKFWDEGGAMTPDTAADVLMPFVDKFDISKTGTFWAPRGPVDIGTIEQTVGPKKDLPTPLELPW